MGVELKSMERVPETMREPIRSYVELYQGLDGDNLLSVTLYGAIAAGTFKREEHTVANVLVLKEVNLWKLYHLAESGSKFGRAGISAPLIMTPEYIRASLDTFPLELIEIQQNHVTIMGDDHFDDLTFENEHVRLECEREVKSLLIRIRQGLLAAAGRDKVLGGLASEVLTELTRVFRGILWLKGVKDPKPTTEVLTAVEKAIEHDLPNVREAVSQPDNRGWDQLRHLYKDVEKLGTVIDVW